MNHRLIFNSKIKTFIFINLVFIILDILLNIYYPSFKLYWPAHNILPGILNAKINLLEFDFFTSNYAKTPQNNLINIYSLFFPRDHEKILSIFSLLSIYLTSFSLTIQLFVATSIFINIKNIKEKNKSSFTFCSTFIFFSLLYKFLFIIKFPLRVLFSQNYENISQYIYNPVLTIIQGANFGGWGFPGASSAGRTLSLSLSLLSISIYLLNDINKVKFTKTIKYSILSLSFILNLLATYIHPVSPLATILIMLSYFYISKNYKLFTNWRKVFLVNCSAYVIGIFLLIKNFPQSEINNSILYDIYVVIRHPHHYLPSFYLTDKLFLNSFIINFIIFILVFVANKYFFRNTFLKRLLIASITCTVALNALQYFFVEYLKINSFIKFGIISVNYVYNFLYFIAIIYFIYLCKSKFRIFSIINSRIKTFQKYSTNLNQKTIFYLLLPILISLSLICFNLNLTKIDVSYSKKLNNFISNNNFAKDAEFVFDKKVEKFFEYKREIAGINVYSDDYFPFNIESIVEWKKRKNGLQNLYSCIDSKSSQCILKSNNREVFYISNKISNKFSNNVKEFTINKDKFIIQEIYSKNKK